jgi:hypothetical protein
MTKSSLCHPPQTTFKLKPLLDHGRGFFEQNSPDAGGFQIVPIQRLVNWEQKKGEVLWTSPFFLTSWCFR